MSRCAWPQLRLFPLAAALALALGACGGGGDDPGEEATVAPAVPAPAPAPAPEPEPLSDEMPVEGLEPDGRMAPWAVAVQIGATMHALGEACGQHDQASLGRMRAGQRAEMTAGGVDADGFDTVWDWARRHAEDNIAAQPPEELEKGCARLIEMEEEAGRMGEMMQKMSQSPP